MKARSTLLVGLGVVVFVVGAGLVLVSLRQHKSAPAVAVRAASPTAVPPVVVVTRPMPAGTTGDALIQSGAVTLVQPPADAYRSDDLTSINALSEQALTSAVATGQPIETSNLHLDPGDVTAPAGDESISLTISSGPASVAGYVGPGDKVDIYGNVSKTSNAPGQSETLPLPCTTRLATQVPVLDVSTQVPSYRGDKTAAGRSVPSGITFLLAVPPPLAATLIYYQTNESLYLTVAATTAPTSGMGDCPALVNSPQLTPAP